MSKAHNNKNIHLATRYSEIRRSSSLPEVAVLLCSRKEDYNRPAAAKLLSPKAFEYMPITLYANNMLIINSVLQACSLSAACMDDVYF